MLKAPYLNGININSFNFDIKKINISIDSINKLRNSKTEYKVRESKSDFSTDSDCDVETPNTTVTKSYNLMDNHKKL